MNLSPHYRRLSVFLTNIPRKKAFYEELVPRLTEGGSGTGRGAGFEYSCRRGCCDCIQRGCVCAEVSRSSTVGVKVAKAGKARRRIAFFFALIRLVSCILCC